MEFDNVPQIVLGIVKEKPDFTIGMREEDTLENDHVGMSVNFIKFWEFAKK